MRILNRQARYDVLVAGGGPAGMMAAGEAARRGLRTALLEKNSRLGWKLSITGKGRCNVTNDSTVQELVASTPGNGRFLYGAFSRFGAQAVMRFFEGLGVPLKVERGRRVFPQSDHAADIVEAMQRFLRQNGVEVLHGTAESLLLGPDGVEGLHTSAGPVRAAHTILACGGCSYPATGSTGDGYRLAQQAGHTVTPLRPSLVPFVAEDGGCAEMQGLALKNIAISVRDTKKKKEIYRDFGEMLFTHFGVSGPVILSASSHMREMEAGRYEVHIDLKPALSPEQLDARLVREFAQNQNRDFINALGGLLPRTMIPVVVRRSGIAPQEKCNRVTREERQAFARLLKDFPVRVRGFRPVEEAIVTAGGVNVKEVDPKTMRSRLAQGLSFAGELLDVDAYTGGFNLQIAFSTGYLAAASLAPGEGDGT